MSVLTIQSRVASGYVGNTVAAPCLQALGVEAVAVDTVLLSNHPAHGRYAGRTVPAPDVAVLLDGVAAHCPDAGGEAVLSGYLGTPETGPVVLEAVAAARRRAPGTLYCLDPVMGDNGKVYVEEALVGFFRDTALPEADLVIPNAFEAGLLLGREEVTRATAAAALRALRARGPARAVITGIAEGDDLVSVAADAVGSWRVRLPRLQAPSSGAGDAFTAILLGVLLRNGGDLGAALGHAASAVHAVLEETRRRGAADLALVPTLRAVPDPPRRFEVTAL